MTDYDKRLIEDYLPIQAISAEAAREKSLRKGHISTLHLWWARRPLVACRAAVYGALVPASRFVPDVNLKNPPEDPDTATRRREGTAKGLGRGAAAQFVERLCKYPGVPAAIAEAQRHILEAHAERLTRETGKPVTVGDIATGGAPRPKVLDMFAGGGAIPLEALRLGCEAYALDLNPVAHIIELCTLVYPQKYGRADRTGKGCAKDGTWAGLAEEVHHWGDWVLQRVRKEIGDLYPSIPDPHFKGTRNSSTAELWKETAESSPPGYLTPVAYLWTRTVTCKNPSCKASIPLVKQTWLCKKEGRSVALKVVAPKAEKRVRFQVVEARSASALGFNPDAGSKGGNAACPFCGTVAETEFVKAEGRAGRLGDQLVAIVAATVGSRGWVYLSPDEVPSRLILDEKSVRQRLAHFLESSGIAPPNEGIAGLPNGSFDNTLGITVRPYGLTRFADLFSARQLLFHLHTVKEIRELAPVLAAKGYEEEHRLAVLTMLACVVDRATDFGCKLCVWNAYKDSGTTHAFGRQTITMVWDYSEVNPFNTGNASWSLGLDRIVRSLADAEFSNPGKVHRGSATALPFRDGEMDAVICDPPYYDNVPYSDISDFFYVWLHRTVGALYPQHFAAPNAPKKAEAIADADRHGGDKEKAKRFYEEMMAKAFSEANRVLKPGGVLAIVYAHKTTLGWATLVEALRAAGFTVTEAWPLDTEKPGRLRAQESAALASSIFLVARKREGDERGQYETEVRPELERIVHERVATLWDMRISGADLVIACVGAGLRAFTHFARVEYANGEEVPAERFLTEVETAVLESILARLSREVGGNGGKYSLAGVDPATRLYILWRYTYKAAELDAGEAIIFANGTHVELDGPHGLSAGPRPLVEKKKGKYRLLDYAERGEDENLGLPRENGETASLVDALHRTLWLMERRPGKLVEFFRETQLNREQMRLVAQALAGPALKGGELSDVSPSGELAALAKLTANWRSVVEEVAMTPAERDERTTGQKHIDFGKEGRR